MERLTYKFPTLALANFAVNAIRKDKVGEVTNSQNGYITVETTNIPAVKQIVEGVRGSEIFRESVEEAFKSSSVPAGASQEVHDKARRDNPYKVRLNKGVPAGARDELKKTNQGLKGKILDKKNAKKEDMEESATKAALEDFMYALPKAAIAELRPVMKMKQGVGRMAKITSVLKKHGITQKFMGAYPTSVVNDYFDTFHGESVEEAKPMVGGQKKLDANKNGKLDAHDFKLLRAKKEEVEVNEAAPTIKAGMKLRAKVNKSVSNGSVVKGEQYKVADAGKNKFDLIHLSIGFRKAIRNVDASVIQALMQNKVLG